RRRHRQHLPPQSIHVVAVQACSTVEQLRGIDQMRLASLVDEYLDVWMTRDDRAGCPRVIEMDVREQQVRDIRQRDPLPAQLFLQTIEAGCRSRIDERDLPRASDDGRRDYMTTSEKMQIEITHTGREHHERLLVIGELAFVALVASVPARHEDMAARQVA